MISMKDLILGATMRAAHIPRYSAIPVNHRESVAEHSFFVAIYADRISIDLGYSAETNRQSVRAALWHDIEETLTGDFIRSFKYNDHQLKRMMDFAARDCALTVFREMLGRDNASIAIGSWDDAKNNGPVGRVVKFSDFLSVVAYVAKEAAMGNKYAIHMMQHALPDYANIFKVDTDYSEFRPYMEEVDEIIGREGWKDIRVTI